MPVSFIFGNGGVGDYINWCSAVQYVADEHPHADVRIFTSELFYDVAKHLFGHIPRWGIYLRKDFAKYYESRSLIAFPKPGTQLINACGAHLMDLGFYYFLDLDPPPESHNYLLDLKYNGPWKWPELDEKSKYAIFTPGSTTEVREMPVKAFDELVAYTLEQGITPVFLGKRELSDNYRAKFLNYDFSRGVDLRERTTLLEATQIMRGAQFVIGLDNGLLHMAGTTDVPVIFGHNIASLKHRILRRRKGLTINMVVSEEELGCIGCQSKMRFLYKHDFRSCFYKGTVGEKACLDLLFKNDSQEWKNAIDRAIDANRNRL
jgi:hypothetical protein